MRNCNSLHVNKISTFTTELTTGTLGRQVVNVLNSVVKQEKSVVSMRPTLECFRKTKSMAAHNLI